MCDMRRAHAFTGKISHLQKGKACHIYFCPDIRPIWIFRTLYLILPHSISQTKPEGKIQNVIFYSFSSSGLHLQRYFHDHTNVYLVSGMINFICLERNQRFSIQCFHRLWHSTLHFVFAGGGGVYGCITEGDLDTVLQNRTLVVAH